MAAWEVGGEETQARVIIETPEGTQEELFDPTTKLKDAVVQTAQKYGFNTVIVRDADGNEIEQDEGDKELSQFATPIRIAPKTVGA